MEKDALTSLRRMGLNQYEAQTYLALVTGGATTAGDLSDVAGIPRPRIYDVLTRLEKRGFATMQPGRPVKYSALPVDEAVKTLKKKRETAFAAEMLELEKTGEALGKSVRGASAAARYEPDDVVWTLRGRDAVDSKIASMIDGAKNSVIFATTAEGLARKLSAHGEKLREANGRGVEVTALTPKESAAHHIEALSDFAEIVHGEAASRFMVVDGEQAVIFLTPHDADAESELGLWVKSPVLARTLADVVGR